MPTTPPPQSSVKQQENSWIQAIRKGDMHVFTEIYEAYGDLIYVFIKRKINDYSLAEDLTADVFLKAFKHISTCCAAQSPNIKARLYTIARNRVIDEYKRSSSVQMHADFEPEGNEKELSATMSSSMIADKIMYYVQTLGQEPYDLFIMRFRQQLTYKEISIITKKSVDANKKLYSRTAKKIATHFTGFTIE